VTDGYAATRHPRIRRRPLPIRSTLSEFGGKTYFDVRLWVEPRDQHAAALIPSKRGLSLPLEFLPEIGEALEAINEATKSDQGELVGRLLSLPEQ
jgi:hypothetical protein